MRKILIIILITLGISLFYRARLDTEEDRVGRSIETTVTATDVRLTLYQLAVRQADPPVLWAYGPNPTIIAEAANNSSAVISIRVLNTGIGPNHRFTGPGLIAAKTGKDKQETVLTVRCQPGKKAVLSTPRPDDFSDFRFIIMGDNRGDEQTFAKILKKAKEYNAAWMINLGDLVDKGRRAEYERYDETIKAAGLAMPFLMLPGNHDIENAGASTYKALYGPGSYSFDYGRYHFAVIESSAETISPEDMTWLKQDLDKSIMPQAVVFTHVPMDDPRRFWRHALGDPSQVEELAQLFRSKRVTMIAASHIHGFYEYDFEGVKNLITGGGGAPLVDAKQKNHFVIVDVRGDDLKIEKVEIGTRDPFVSRVWYAFKSGLDVIMRSNTFIYSLTALVLALALIMAIRRLRV